MPSKKHASQYLLFLSHFSDPLVRLDRLNVHFESYLSTDRMSLGRGLTIILISFSSPFQLTSGNRYYRCLHCKNQFAYHFPLHSQIIDRQDRLRYSRAQHKINHSQAISERQETAYCWYCSNNIQGNSLLPLMKNADSYFVPPLILFRISANYTFLSTQSLIDKQS